MSSCPPSPPTIDFLPEGFGGAVRLPKKCWVVQRETGIFPREIRAFPAPVNNLGKRVNMFCWSAGRFRPRTLLVRFTRGTLPGRRVSGTRGTNGSCSNQPVECEAVMNSKHGFSAFFRAAHRSRRRTIFFRSA